MHYDLEKRYVLISQVWTKRQQPRSQQPTGGQPSSGQSLVHRGEGPGDGHLAQGPEIGRNQTKESDPRRHHFQG